MNMYHLSRMNHDEVTFFPRVPKSVREDEDNITPRICFSKTISGAWRAHPAGGGGDLNGMTRYTDMYVHVPADKVNHFAVKKPDSCEVYDSSITDEIWLMEPAKLKCIGKIRIAPHQYREDKRYKVSFRWLRKF